MPVFTPIYLLQKSPKDYMYQFHWNAIFHRRKSS